MCVTIVVCSGFTPRKPDVLQLDTMAPVLQRWYLQREAKSFTAHLFFDEPIHLVNASRLNVYYTTRNAQTGRPVEYGSKPMDLASALALYPATVSYADNNKRVTLKLSNYCTSHIETTMTDDCFANDAPSANLYAFLNRTDNTRFGYFLTMDGGAAEDFAVVANPSRQIKERQALAESGPGTWRNF
jgi:hypothetical protein